MSAEIYASIVFFFACVAGAVSSLVLLMGIVALQHADARECGVGVLAGALAASVLWNFVPFMVWLRSVTP